MLFTVSGDFMMILFFFKAFSWATGTQLLAIRCIYTQGTHLTYPVKLLTNEACVLYTQISF